MRDVGLRVPLIVGLPFQPCRDKRGGCAVPRFLPAPRPIPFTVREGFPGSGGPEYLFRELRSGCVRDEMEEARSENLFLPPPVPGMNGMDDNADVAGMRCVQVANPDMKTRPRDQSHGAGPLSELVAGPRDGGKSEIIVREK